jgi:Negative regulator of sigma E activity
MLANNAPAKNVLILRSLLIAFLFLSGFASTSARADQEDEKEKATQWLERAVSASRGLNYQGMVTYFQNNHAETATLRHLAQSGGYQHMEIMDPHRETITIDNEVRCYLPDERAVLSAPYTLRNVFPMMIRPEMDMLVANYHFELKKESARIAGREAQVAIFKPKDNLRYEHRYWSDLETGLILAAHLHDQNNILVERFEFVKIEIDGKDLENEKAAWPEVPDDWRVERLAARNVTPMDTGWMAGNLPKGFRLVAEEQRTFQGNTHPTNLLVFSDGFTAISVFIEENRKIIRNNITQSDIELGYFNAHAYKKDGFWITSIGRAPHDTLRLIAQSIVRKQTN